MSIISNKSQPILLALIVIISLMAAPGVISAQPGFSPAKKVGIPPVAWSRGMGVPFDGAGHPYEESTKIDDGPWAGLPLGGLGSGAIGRTYSGDFARWHLDLGTHRFESLPANQFSVYIYLEYVWRETDAGYVWSDSDCMVLRWNCGASDDCLAEGPAWDGCIPVCVWFVRGSSGRWLCAFDAPGSPAAEHRINPAASKYETSKFPLTGPGSIHG